MLFPKLTFTLVLSTPLLAHAVAPLELRATDTCSVSGLSGQCISTSACKSSGGTSTPGHCPGPTDIQCCTYGTCKSGAGKCGPTSSCSGGTLTAGLCPGPSDIQCCTPNSSGGGGSCPPAVNAATVALIKEFEGFVASPSPDPIGLPTVGYGHLCQTKGCSEVPYKFPLTEAEATALLDSDLKTYESCLRSAVKVALNANQYGALVSWTFNEGCGAMESSTLVNRLNAHEDPDTVAAQELPKWDIAGGNVLPGLQRRRAAEVALFKTATSAKAIPC